MKFFKTKIFALIGFSLFLVSCSPSISVKAENSDAATIGFSANFSLSANSAFKEFLDLAQENSGLAENTNSTLFSKQELENFLISAGAKNVSANVEKDGKTSASGKIENLSKSLLASSKILSKTQSSLTFSLGPEQCKSIYEKLDEETQGYFDLLMIPCLNDEKMNVEEYENLLSFVYGPDLAKQIVSQNLQIELKSPDSRKILSQKIKLGELLTLNEQKSWSASW